MVVMYKYYILLWHRCQKMLFEVKGLDHFFLLTALKQEDMKLLHTLVDFGLDIHLKDNSARSCHDVVNSKTDVDKKKKFVAALHRRPPKPWLMSAGKKSGDRVD